MDNFMSILSLLIITGIFIIGFAFSILLKSSSPSSPPDVEKEQRMVVADMIESLRKICPVGIKKGWTLISADYSSPRNWKKQSLLPVLRTKIMLYGSSLIVKSVASVVMDLISKPFYWDEWDSCYFSSSMRLSENERPELRGDKYMKCILVNRDKMSHSQSNASMYCFSNLPSDNVRWILFWNIVSLDWWFFLIQPSMRKSDVNHCLLTVIQGTDSASYEDRLAKAVWLRIRNIKDAAEFYSFKVFPFNPVLEHPFTPDVDVAESVKHCTSCKKRSHTESCCKELHTETNALNKSSADVLLQLVPSSGCDLATFESSRKFNICLTDIQPTQGSQASRNPESSSYHHKIGHNTRKERSLTVMSTETASVTCVSKKLFGEIKTEPQASSTTDHIKNISSPLHNRSSVVGTEWADGLSNKCENDILNSKGKNLDLGNTSPRLKECDSRTSETRKQSFVEFRSKFPRISSLSLNQKAIAETSEIVLMESESHLGMLDTKSDLLASDSSKIVSTAHESSSEMNTLFIGSGESSGSLSNLNLNATNSEIMPPILDHSTFSSNEGSGCEGNCSPICDVCLKAADLELSDFEVLLPHLIISEERIAVLVTKGNYCAAELQAEVHEASQVKMTGGAERKNCGGKWTCMSSNKEVDLFLKTKEEGSLKILSYLCQTSFPVSLNRVWNFIRNPRMRFICDETTKKVTVLEELPEQQKIIYTYHEFGGLLKKEAVDFCLLHSERVEHLKYSLSYFSIEYENCPLSTAVRGMLFPSGWVIEKLQGNSDDCKITYLVQVVLNRPDSLLVQESSNIVLQSIQNLRNYFISAPGNIKKN